MRGEKYLTKPQQYALVYRKGSSLESDLLVLKVLPNGLMLSRYGLSVSKRVGKAVTRNKIKRLLRELMRIMPVKPGWDMVLIVRPMAAIANYDRLKRTVEDLLSRADMLQTEEERGFVDEIETGSSRGLAVS